MGEKRETTTKQKDDQAAYIQMVSELLAKRYDHPPLAHVKTFGCQQNVSDGEKLKGLLMKMGYGLVEDPQQADLAIFNTCAVRENAESRVFGHVGALKPVKSSRKGMLIGLCGCMMQQQHIADTIRESYPYVDLVFGTHALHTLPMLLYKRLSGEKRQFSTEQQDGEIVEGVPVSRDSAIKANLPIMYGCDNFCTYCVVPYVRGRERSRLPQHVLEEAKSLAAAGYKEITLLGQNVNSYGKGLSEQIDFSELLSQAAAIPGEFWLRFMTSHPKDCTERLIDTIAANPKVCRHIHLPVQSGSNRVLREMNRRYTVERYLELIDYARKTIPGVSFSSDIIVGFPGETDDDFSQTLRLIETVRYNALFTFIYSPRHGTRAAQMDDPATPEEKGARMTRLLDAQSAIREQLQNDQIGRTVRVLADGPGRRGNGWVSGRMESADIVEFVADSSVIGSFTDVKIESALNWALFGKQVGGKPDK